MTQHPNPPLGGDEAKVEPLDELLKRAVAAFKAMSPEDQAAHMEAQKKSWVAAEMAFGDEGTRVGFPVQTAAPVLPVEVREKIAATCWAFYWNELNLLKDSGLTVEPVQFAMAGDAIRADYFRMADAILSTIKGDA